MVFLCYERCGTCKKARAWLDRRGVRYEERAIKENHPDREELARWWQMSGLPLKRFFNTSGQAYRSLGLAKKLLEMSEDEQLDLLASDGMLVKRPLLIGKDRVLVGFKEAEWEKNL